MKTLMRTITALPVLVTISFLGSVSTTYSQDAEIELVYASSLANTYRLHKIQGDEWAERIREATDGRVQIRTIYGGALLTGMEQLSGVARGTADFTQLSVQFFPGELPMWNTLSNLIDLELGTEIDVRAQTIIAVKLLEEFPSLKNEIERHGVKVMWPGASSHYSFLSKTPVTAFSDLRGKRVRAFTGPIGQLLDAAGAISVTVDSPEIYSSLATGVIDATFLATSFQVSAKFYEVAPYPVFIGAENVMPIGLCCINIVNQDTWDSLPADIQEIILRVNDEMTAETMNIMYEESLNTAENLVELSGNEPYVLTAEERADWAAASPNFLAEFVAIADQEGAPGAEIVARIREIVAQYQAGDLEAMYE